MDEETKHYANLLKIKQALLYKLDEQAAGFGMLHVPPHIEMERDSLRDEISMLETAIQTPARAEITDELGPAGRFLVNHQELREIRRTLTSFIKSVRVGFLVMGGVLVGVVVVVAIIATYLIVRGGR